MMPLVICQYVPILSDNGRLGQNTLRVTSQQLGRLVIVKIESMYAGNGSVMSLRLTGVNYKQMQQLTAGNAPTSLVYGRSQELDAIVDRLCGAIWRDKVQTS